MDRDAMSLATALATGGERSRLGCPASGSDPKWTVGDRARSRASIDRIAALKFAQERKQTTGIDLFEVNRSRRLRCIVRRDTNADGFQR